jgi:outer membrane protein assembly factor BamE (lipoprotein component of BamABCDE complex)
MQEMQLVRLAPALLPVLVALTPACVVISTDGKAEVSGQYVSATTLEQIEPGASPEYVRSLLGDPTTSTGLSDGTCIWKWVHTETSRSQSHLLFLVNASKQSEGRHTAYVQFEDGVVSRCWRD